MLGLKHPSCHEEFETVWVFRVSRNSQYAKGAAVRLGFWIKADEFLAGEDGFLRSEEGAAPKPRRQHGCVTDWMVARMG